MYSEINSAISFLSNFLFDKLPRRKVNLFAQQLANFLLMRYEKHWSPSEPHKGTELRRIQIKVHGGITDSLISVTASNVGLDIDEVLQYWPDELTIWVDPGEVTYRIGERAPAMIIYSASEANNALLNRLLSQGSGVTAEGNALRLNLPDANESAISLSLPPPPPVPHPPPPSLTNNVSNPTFELSSPNDVQFTVGSFAMTRFGTTKVKNSPATLNRLRQKHRSRPQDHHPFRSLFTPSVSPPSIMTEPPRSLAPSINNGISGNSPAFCAAPGSRPSNGNASSSLNPSTSNSSPQSSSRDLDSDTNSSPINDLNSLLFGLPSPSMIRPGVWSNF